MSREKRLFEKGRVSVYVVFLRLRELKYFDGVYFVPSILTFTLNTLSSSSKYQFTRYVQLAFLWLSIEIRVEYGKYTDSSFLASVINHREQELFEMAKGHMERMEEAGLRDLVAATANIKRTIDSFKSGFYCKATAVSTEDDDINNLINNAQ